MLLGQPRPRDAVRTHRHLRRYVLPHEHVVVATRRHWARLLEPIATTAAAFFLVGALVMSTSVEVRATVQWLWVAWFLVLGRLVWKWLEWRYEWFVATDKRLLLLYGLIVHRVSMMPLKKVTDMGYSRSPLGQVLGYGRFDMESAGQDQALRTINFVPSPDDTYRTLCDTIFTPGSNRGTVDDDDLPGPPPSGPPPSGPPPSVVPGSRPPGDVAEPRPTTQPIKVSPVVPAPRPDDAGPVRTNTDAVRTTDPGARYALPESDGGGAHVPDPFL